MKQLIEFYYRTNLERQTDFIGLLTIIIAYNNSKKDEPKENKWRAELTAKLRLLFESSTLKLSDSAVEIGYLNMSDLSKEIAKLYKAFPTDLFDC